MKNGLYGFCAAGLLVGAAIGLVCLTEQPAMAQTVPVPSGMKIIAYVTFGTNPGRTIQNLTQLEAAFNPYGIAGTSVIHQEWERYQWFNTTNFVFTGDKLNLTATIPPGGGLFPGGINSAQIWTKARFQPGVTGYTYYAIDVAMKVPGSVGMWPAVWLMSPSVPSDGSEVDIAEFQNMKWQNSYDWTGFNDGPGNGTIFYSQLTNPWVWHPGYDFSTYYHDYMLLWTPTATYKSVDGHLVLAQNFHWTAKYSPQLGINLAVGSSEAGATGLIPSSLSEFPAVLSIDHITIWAK